MHALSQKKPFPKNQLAKSLCAEMGKHNFKGTNVAEGGSLSQNVTDPHSRRCIDNSHTATVLTSLRIKK